MDATTQDGRPAGPLERWDRRLLWWMAIVPLLGALSARDLWAPDEPRYGQVAREMLASGDWLVPHVNAKPYAEKPPVYWWGATALSAPFGRVTAVTARLGGAVYAFGCVFLIALLAGRWFKDRAVGVTAAALFASMIFIQWVSQRAALDLPLTFYMLLAIERGEVWLASGRLSAALLCGAAWAAAILTKGPLGLLFPPVALAAGAIAARRAPSWRNAGWILVPAVMAGLCLAWLLPALEAGGEAYGDRLLGQIKGRATGGEGHHLRPIYYFVERAPVVTMPWSLHLLAGLGAMLALRRRPEAHRRGLATCAAIGFGGFILLSLIKTKREVYLLPLVPFVCAGTAYAIHAGLYPRIERWGRLLMIGTPVAMALGLLALPVVGPRFLMKNRDLPIDWTHYLPLAPAAAILLLGAWAVFRVRSDPPRAIRLTAFVLMAGMTIVSLGFLPRIDDYRSYRPAAVAAERYADGGTIYNAGFGQAPNLLWSLDRRTTPELHHPSELATALPEHGPIGAAVVGRGWWDAYRKAHPEAMPWIREVWREPVDYRRLIVLTNRPDNP